MTRPRKISIRKVLQALVTLVVTTACMAAILGATRIHKERKLGGLRVRIANPVYKFVDETEIEGLLLNSNKLNIEQDALDSIDLARLEKVIDANPWISNAELYIDNRKVLHAEVTQRTPVVRVIERDGNSYYLDADLQAMPLSRKYTHYASVVTNVPPLKSDSASRALKGKIISLVHHIEQDSFWNAQVSQIILTDDGTFELLPILGRHRIILGDTSRLGEKFDNLFAFYTNVLNRIGWNKYEVLDLRFKGQVVASPKLPWEKPEGYALSHPVAAEPVPVGNRVDKTESPEALLVVPGGPNEEHLPVLQQTSRQISAETKDVPTVPKEQEAKNKKSEPKEKTEQQKPVNTQQPAKPKYIYPGTENEKLN